MQCFNHIVQNLKHITSNNIDKFFKKLAENSLDEEDVKMI